MGNMANSLLQSKVMLITFCHSKVRFGYVQYTSNGLVRFVTTLEWNDVIQSRAFSIIGYMILTQIHPLLSNVQFYELFLCEDGDHQIPSQQFSW